MLRFAAGHSIRWKPLQTGNNTCVPFPGTDQFRGLAYKHPSLATCSGVTLKVQPIKQESDREHLVKLLTLSGPLRSAAAAACTLGTGVHAGTKTNILHRGIHHRSVLYCVIMKSAFIRHFAEGSTA